MPKTENPRPLGKALETPINLIKPAPDNPRKIPEKAVEQVAKSIQQFGWQQPLVVDNNQVIIAGHTRYLAAKKLGLKTVPCIKATHLTPEQAHAYRIADNRSHDYTTWDYPELIQQINELDDFNDVLDVADWATVLDSIPDPEPLDLEDETAPASSQPAPDTPLDLDDETAALIQKQFLLVVECLDEEARDEIEYTLAHTPGVLNVRRKRE